MKTKRGGIFEVLSAPDNGDVWRLLTRQEIDAVMDEGGRHLSEHERLIIDLYYYKEMFQKDIADVIGRTET